MMLIMGFRSSLLCHPVIFFYNTKFCMHTIEWENTEMLVVLAKRSLLAHLQLSSILKNHIFFQQCQFKHCHLLQINHLLHVLVVFETANTNLKQFFASGCFYSKLSDPVSKSVTKGVQR